MIGLYTKLVVKGSGNKESIYILFGLNYIFQCLY